MHNQQADAERFIPQIHARMNIRLELIMPLIKERLAVGETVRFTTHGISMLPLLRNGKDQVLLAPLPEKLKKYDLPLYQREDGSYVLHRIVKVGETFTCIGDNQYTVERGVRPEWMIGLAVGVCRKGKMISVDGLGYKVYVRVWHWIRPVRRVMFFVCRFGRAIMRRMKRVFGK